MGLDLFFKTLQPVHIFCGRFCFWIVSQNKQICTQFSSAITNHFVLLLLIQILVMAQEQSLVQRKYPTLKLKMSLVTHRRCCATLICAPQGSSKRPLSQRSCSLQTPKFSSCCAAEIPMESFVQKRSFWVICRRTTSAGGRSHRSGRPTHGMDYGCTNRQCLLQISYKTWLPEFWGMTTIS